ncbi:hypothetical protein HDC93_007148 [Streptomyces sp. AK010]|nr:hypothetical protein [Streptomyces sp. AK010]
MAGIRLGWWPAIGLLLLFAQPVGRISRLTIEHVIDRGDRLALSSGESLSISPHPWTT